MRWFARLGLFLIATLLLALLAEGALRALGLGKTPLVSWQTAALHRPDPELIYSLSPGAKGAWRSEEFVERTSINADGMRDRETQILGSESQRVLVLGDSMTFGHGVGDEDTYPNQLEALFRLEGRDVDVVNAGVRGFGTDHEYRYFSQRLRGLRPDLIVLAFYINDMSDDIERPLYRLEGDRLVALDATRHRLYRIGRIYEWLPQLARRSRLCGWLIPRIAGIGAYPEAPAVRTPDMIREARRRFVRQLASLEDYAREDGFRLLLLAVPYRDGGRDEYLWLHREPDLASELFDPSTSPEWKDRAHELFFHDDEHLTKAGNRLLAEQLHRYIEQNDLL